MDFDGDGDLDLVVSCPDKPYNGTYFFENPDGNRAMPVFAPGVRVGPGHRNIRVSYLPGRPVNKRPVNGGPFDGEPRVLVPGREYPDFPTKRFAEPVAVNLPPNVHTPGRKIRANQWNLVDYDGDARLECHDRQSATGVTMAGTTPYDERGRWTNGPLRGFVYIARNAGTSSKPRYERPEKILTEGQPLEVYGWPSPQLRRLRPGRRSRHPLR